MASLRTEGLLEHFGKQISLASTGTPTAEALALGWIEVDALLPDHGVPRGVVEVRAPRALGGGTSLALAIVRAAQQRDARGWCAWIDPDSTLYSPGIAMAGVDLHRLAVVRPPRKDLLRIAIKVARSQAFDVVVIDVDPAPGGQAPEGAKDESVARRRLRKDDAILDLFVRKLAMLAAEGGATILLLTDGSVVRSAPLPVALRLELTRTERALSLRVGKERHGRIGLAKTVPLDTKPGLKLEG